MAEVEAPERAEHGGTVLFSAGLGEMVWLYAMSEMHRTWPVEAVHQWLLPALVLRQYRIYRRDQRPVGLVTWAWLSQEVETAYVRDPQNLQPADWQSGDRGWILDLIAPFGDARRIARDLKHAVFAGDVGRSLRVRKGDPTMRIKYLHGANALARARDRERNPTVALHLPGEPAR